MTSYVKKLEHRLAQNKPYHCYFVVVPRPQESLGQLGSLSDSDSLSVRPCCRWPGGQLGQSLRMGQKPLLCPDSAFPSLCCVAPLPDVSPQPCFSEGHFDSVSPISPLHQPNGTSSPLYSLSGRHLPYVILYFQVGHVRLCLLVN